MLILISALILTFTVGCLSPESEGWKEFFGESETPVARQMKVSSAGSLSFSFRTPERFYPHKKRPIITRGIVKIPRFLMFQISQTGEDCRLSCRWAGRNEPVVARYSDFPGPAWYRVLITWRASDGVADLYLNGKPVCAPGVTGAAWKVLHGERFLFQNQLFRVRNARITTNYIAPELVERADEQIYSVDLKAKQL